MIDGSAVCWGSNMSGQSAAPAGTFSFIAAGVFNTCALTTADAVVCWGANESGQSSPPVDTFSEISVGDSHSCGVKSDGSLWCWGGPGSL
jgi:alpha-tubulin suppressor-like RCC1 family protein